ncbi:GIY-YIG nuclease family protein [Microbacterium sp. SSW1-49]|uniref:GIY-YIG nuclease family protein n=1 Tax=Microbacterium croceum TaxID=2851645 RepID=A0ABT0FFM3_9MICO|nr:GIY-YIG nuclease family protein [Microbacterium croceum]MCK2036867.1 GIY-YIG nuclease family protein [Microbacterium croceum]
MDSTDALPGPCLLCASLTGTRVDQAWLCAVCGWRYGDVPDDGLPLPRVDVVYYLRFDRRVKIGTSHRPRQRLKAIRHDELLAFERGDRALERRRHKEFAALREGGEWFTLTPTVETHVAGLRAAGEPWSLYARWFSEALQHTSS